MGLNGKKERISDVSETLLIPLFCRAIETESKEPIVSDPKSVEIVRQLVYNRDAMIARLPKRNRNHLITIIALRTKRFDDYVLEFLSRHPDGIVVNIGCGLDTRFTRIDNGSVEWYDLDLPDVIEIRQRFFRESDRYHFISSSALTFPWMESLSGRNKPFLFLAEGVFEYLQEEEVKSLVLHLRAAFPGAELVCEVVSRRIAKMMQSRFWKRRLQAKARFGSDAVFNWGIKASDELEGWHSGIEFLDEFFYLNPQEKRLGWYRWLGVFDSLKKGQWIVHYKLN
jgi:methyltransferase (TIGR00027 family)